MNSHKKIITATKLIGVLLLFIGTSTLIYGIIGNLNSVIGIGIGVDVGAIFIVLIGMFFVATEEMVETMFKGEKVSHKQPQLHVIKKP